MVTHDRFFLERVCNEIIELDNGKIYQYKGNYSYYLEKKAEAEAKSKTNKILMIVGGSLLGLVVITFAVLKLKKK